MKKIIKELGRALYSEEEIYRGHLISKFYSIQTIFEGADLNDCDAPLEYANNLEDLKAQIDEKLDY